MSDHVFTIKNRPTMGGLVFSCSCGRWKGPVFPVVGTDEIPLVKFNEIAHKHIEAVEAEDAEDDAEMYPSAGPVNWAGRMVRAETVRVEGYGTKSAITSEDELVDIETGLRKGASG